MSYPVLGAHRWGDTANGEADSGIRIGGVGLADLEASMVLAT